MEFPKLHNLLFYATAASTIFCFIIPRVIGANLTERKTTFWNNKKIKIKDKKIGGGGKWGLIFLVIVWMLTILIILLKPIIPFITQYLDKINFFLWTLACVATYLNLQVLICWLQHVDVFAQEYPNHNKP